MLPGVHATRGGLGHPGRSPLLRSLCGAWQQDSPDVIQPGICIPAKGKWWCFIIFLRSSRSLDSSFYVAQSFRFGTRVKRNRRVFTSRLQVVQFHCCYVSSKAEYAAMGSLVTTLNFRIYPRQISENGAGALRAGGVSLRFVFYYHVKT